MINENREILTESAIRNIWNFAWKMWNSGVPGKFMFTYNLLVRWWKNDKTVKDPDTGNQIVVRTVIAGGKSHPYYIALKFIIKDIAENGIRGSKLEPEILTKARKKLHRALGIDGYMEIADREAKKIAREILKADRRAEDAIVKVAGTTRQDAYQFTTRKGQKYLAIARKGSLDGRKASMNKIKKIVKLRESNKIEVNKENIKRIIKEETEKELSYRNIEEGAINNALKKLSPTHGADSMTLQTLVAYLLLKFILDEFSRRLPRLLDKYNVSLGSNNVDSLIRGSLGIIAKTVRGV